MVPVKNYETVSKFVKGMLRILMTLFFRTRCRLYSVYKIILLFNGGGGGWSSILLDNSQSHRVCVCMLKDYTSFVKRIIRLVQTYLSVKNVELEMRPFSDADESLDARGQPLIASSSAPTASALPPSATDDARVTSPVDGDATKPASRKKTRKKRRSSGSRKLEATVDEITTEHVDTGLFSFCKLTVM